MSYYQSPKDCRHIIILGIGAKKIGKDHTASNKLPGFTFEWVESSPPHIIPYARILKQTFDPENPTLMWQDQSSSTCELVLNTTERNPENGETAIYVATTAHTVESQLFPDETPAVNPLTNVELRRAVESNTTNNRYTITSDVPPTRSAVLGNPPLLSCRYYYNMTAETRVDPNHSLCAENKCNFENDKECIHRYMNDIAILQMNPRDIRIPGIQRSFRQIIPAGIHNINRLLRENRTLVYVRDIACRLLPLSITSIDQQRVRGICALFMEEEEGYIRYNYSHLKQLLFLKCQQLLVKQ